MIIEKYAVRNTPPTHLRILLENDEKIEISPNEAVVDAAEIGDSLIKIKNENIVFLKTEEGISERFYYTRDSYKDRRSKHFPEEWREKWLESSKWDKSNKK